MLSGLTVVIIHVKQALFPSFAKSDSTAPPDAPTDASGRVLDPRTMQERILQELEELEGEEGLGARFVIAKQGMRIDFQLHSPELASRVTGAFIDREERKGKGASDHAPVVVDLD